MADTARVPSESNVSRESLARIEIYISLLTTWQRQVNLVGPSTLNNIWSRHIVDSLQLLPLLPKSARSIADLGSGAGLPGLVLAMAGNFKAHLYESNQRKAAFLREAIRKTGIDAVVYSIRIEDIPNIQDWPHADIVTARALAPLDKLLSYAEPFLKAGATGLFHKGKDFAAELTEATKYWRIKSVTHPSVTDSKSVILEVKEAIRV